jgi:beta-galactosidase
VTDAALYGGENVLAVKVDATAPDGWWYDGGGIYRHVSLHSADPLHVAPWGVYLPAVVVGPIS